METKFCIECKLNRNVCDFYKNRKKCKTCIAKYKKRYAQENKEKISLQQKKWREENKEYIEKYREKNKNKIQERNKKYWEENKEKQKEVIAKWRKDNALHIKEYRKINKERDKEKAKIWGRSEKGNALRRTITQRYRARKKKLASQLTASEWLKIKRDFNNSCAYCNDKGVNLEQEHFVPVSKGGGLTDNNILPSCRSCNASKNNRDFLEWYKTQNNYSLENEIKIIKYLNQKGANIKYGL